MSIRDQWLDDLAKADAALKAHDAKMAPVIARRDELQAKYEPDLRALNEQIEQANYARSELQWVVGKLTQALGPNVNMSAAA